MAFLWLMFVEPEQLWMVHDKLQYVHTRNQTRTQAICANVHKRPARTDGAQAAAAAARGS